MKKNKKIKILIVDDEPDIQKVLSKILMNKGYAVHAVGDGSDALIYLKKNKADIVLLDIMMPNLNGIETLRKLRKKHKNVVVLMITGYGSMKTVREAMRLGASDYITKPFDVDFIYDVVEASLSELGDVKQADVA